MKTGRFRSPLWFSAGLAALFAAWELLSRFWGSDLIFPGPMPVLAKFAGLLGNPRFLSALRASFMRALAGLSVSAPLGCALGIAAGLDKRAQAFMQPFFSLAAATPVMPVILICFLFLGAEKTPVFAAFLMAFPVMAAASAEGARRVDPLLKEMFSSYDMTRREALFHLYIPTIAPFALGGLKSSLSLSWKAIVAAEVLVQPLRSLGAGMQEAKARLETPELFAWTLGAVSAAALAQGILSLLLHFCFGRGNTQGRKRE